MPNLGLELEGVWITRTVTWWIIFLTDEGKAFPEILLPEPQDSVCVLVSDNVEGSNMSHQSDKTLPFINWQGSQTMWDAKGLW